MSPAIDTAGWTLERAEFAVDAARAQVHASRLLVLVFDTGHPAHEEAMYALDSCREQLAVAKAIRDSLRARRQRLESRLVQAYERPVNTADNENAMKLGI